jgi:hypothetical protein
MRRIVFIALLAEPMLAQQFRGSIVGLITDPQGAAVLNTKIAVAQVNTGARAEKTSGVSGHFTLP